MTAFMRHNPDGRLLGALLGALLGLGLFVVPAGARGDDGPSLAPLPASESSRNEIQCLSGVLTDLMRIDGSRNVYHPETLRTLRGQLSGTGLYSPAQVEIYMGAIQVRGMIDNRLMQRVFAKVLARNGKVTKTQILNTFTLVGNNVLPKDEVMRLIGEIIDELKVSIPKATLENTDGIAAFLKDNKMTMEQYRYLVDYFSNVDDTKRRELEFGVFALFHEGQSKFHKKVADPRGFWAKLLGIKRVEGAVSAQAPSPKKQKAEGEADWHGANAAVRVLRTPVGRTLSLLENEYKFRSVEKLSTLLELAKMSDELSEIEAYAILEAIPLGSEARTKQGLLDFEARMREMGVPGDYVSGYRDPTDAAIVWATLGKLKTIESPDRLRATLPSIHRILEKSHAEKFKGGTYLQGAIEAVDDLVERKIEESLAEKERAQAR